MSVAWVSSADGAGVGIHVAGGAEIIALRAVWIRGDVRLDVGTRTSGVALNAVAACIRAGSEVLSLCAGGDERQRASKNQLFHSQSPWFYCARDTTMGSRCCLTNRQRGGGCVADVHTYTQPSGVAGSLALVHTLEVDRAESQVHLTGEPSR